MHQLFVTMDIMGLKNSGDIDDSFSKVHVYSRFCGDIHQNSAKSPTQIPAVKCTAGLDMK